MKLELVIDEHCEIHNKWSYEYTSFLAGSSKKGNDHIVQSVRLMKVNGSVLSLNVNQSAKHLAVGSSKEHVSLL